MIRKTQRGIWETDARTLDLKNPRVLRWYVARKIGVGDWAALDRPTVARLLPRLDIDPDLKLVLRDYVRTSHTGTAFRASRRWK